MPKPDGWDVLNTLKADPDLCDIPVVMVTVAPERGIGLSLGVADVLTKPVDRARLTALINRLVCRDGPALVVEDDADTRDMTRHTIEKIGLGRRTNRKDLNRPGWGLFLFRGLLSQRRSGIRRDGMYSTSMLMPSPVRGFAVYTAETDSSTRLRIVRSPTVSAVSPLGGAPRSNSTMRQQSSIVAPHGGSLTASSIARPGIAKGS
jgi:CheY-like chemotaxis protein